MLFTSLEQFQIISIFPLKVLCLDFPITNMLFINLIVLLVFSSIVYCFSSDTDYLNKTSYFFIPNVCQTFFEIVYEAAAQLVFDNFNETCEKYFPLITVIFTFILFNILIGLVPYSFTNSSHLIVTLCLFLVPINLISYIFKPISLGVRLFANLMADHTLLKVIVGFAWSMLLLEGFFSILDIVLLLVLAILTRTELSDTIKPLSICNPTLSLNDVVEDFYILNVKRPRSDSNDSEQSSTAAPMDISDSSSVMYLASREVLMLQWMSASLRVQGPLAKKKC